KRERANSSCPSRPGPMFHAAWPTRGYGRCRFLMPTRWPCSAYRPTTAIRSTGYWWRRPTWRIWSWLLPTESLRSIPSKSSGLDDEKAAPDSMLADWGRLLCTCFSRARAPSAIAQGRSAPHYTSSGTGFLAGHLERLVVAAAVDLGHFRSHGAQIGRQLTAVVNAVIVEESEIEGGRQVEDSEKINRGR